MSEGNGQAPATPDSRIDGPVGDISKLLQAKAPEVLESPALDPDDQTKPAQVDRAAAAAAAPADDAAAAAADEPTPTAAELAAEAVAGAEKKDTHDVDVAVEGLSVGDVAGKLGVDARKLYEDLRIPLREGRGAISLSELKEGYQAAALLDDGRDKLGAERETWSNEVMVARQEMSVAVDLLSSVMHAELGPAAAPKLAELYEHARGQTAAYRERETASLLARFPDWKDDKVRAGARDQMLEHLAPFGFAAIDLDNVLDHRLVAYVHANMERDRRIAATRAKIETAKGDGRQRAPAARQRPASKAKASIERLTRTARETGRREDQVPAVAALIAAGARTREKTHG